MSDIDNMKNLQYIVNSKFAGLFDELQNIKLTNRKNDIGFLEENKMMLTMRDGTTQIGDTLTGGGGISDLFFFTDYFDNRWAVKGYDNKVWILKNNVWTDLGLGYSGNDFYFNSLNLPIQSDGTVPTEYTTTADSTITAETISIPAGDTTGDAAVGQYLFVTDDPNNNQTFRGCFAVILGIEAGEYLLQGSGISTITKAGLKYQIYDSFGQYLQVTNKLGYDTYISIKSDGTPLVNAYFTGLATASLRRVKALKSNEFVGKQLLYATSYFSFVKGTLYYSALVNPFFHTFDSLATIPGNTGGVILDIFLFKGRMVIAGNNFICYFTWTTVTVNNLQLPVIDMNFVSKSFGIKQKSLIDLGVDAYYISTNKQIFSLSETITGSLKATNIGKVANNYLKLFETKISAGYDGTNLYFYGQPDDTTLGIMLVYNVEYNFWSTYTGLRPSVILLENGSVYLADNNSDIVRIFSQGVQVDVGNEKIEQKVSIKDIDLSDVFSQKTLGDIYLWLDNYEQTLLVDCYMSLAGRNMAKQRKKIHITPSDVEAVVNPIGEGIIGENIIGGLPIEANASFPFLKHIQRDSDSANIWKIVITGFDGSPFYLNEMDVEIKFDNGTKKYFSPADTI